MTMDTHSHLVWTNEGGHVTGPETRRVLDRTSRVGVI